MICRMDGLLSPEVLTKDSCQEVPAGILFLPSNGLLTRKS